MRSEVPNLLHLLSREKNCTAKLNPMPNASKLFDILIGCKLIRRRLLCGTTREYNWEKAKNCTCRFPLKTKKLEGPLLFGAAGYGNLEITNKLLRVGADVNETGWGSRTPLHIAAIGNRTEIIEALITGKADIEAQDSSKQTPLYLAVVGNCYSAVELLLKSGANPNTSNKFFNCPIVMAYDKPEIAKLLINHEKCQLLQLGRSWNNQIHRYEHTETFFLKAVKNARNDTLPLIIAKGEEGYKKEDMDLSLHYLFEGIKNLTGRASFITGRASFINSVRARILNSFKILCKYANIEALNKQCENLFHILVQSHDHNEKNSIIMTLVKELKQTGLNLNQPNSQGNTPLYEALYNSQPLAIIEALITPTNLDIKNNNGNTPLYEALYDSQPLAIIKALITPTNLDIKNNNGNTPLHLMASQIFEYRSVWNREVEKEKTKNLVKTTKNVENKTPIDILKTKFSISMCIHGKQYLKNKGFGFYLSLTDYKVEKLEEPLTNKRALSDPTGSSPTKKAKLCNDRKSQQNE